MNYTKPEVVVLGEAVCVIEQTLFKAIMGVSEVNPRIPAPFNPAYELDE